METLESSRICRLCGKHCGISINIFDKNENHVKKINAVLPIIVHEMDLLPKHMCHRCRYKLEEFHEFYVDCLKTDANLKSQLSWMRKETTKQQMGIPMVQIENIKIKSEPLDHSLYDFEPIVFDLDPLALPSSRVKGANGAFHCEKISSYTTYSDFRHYYCDSKKPKQTSPCVKSGSLSRFVDSASMERHKGARKLPYSRSATEIQSAKNKLIDTRDILHKLRPRRCSINYGGKRKGTFSGRSTSGASPTSHKRSKSAEVDANARKASKEGLDLAGDLNGPNLRPRREIVNYMGEKRKRKKGRVEDSSGSMDGVDRRKNEKSNPMGDLTMRVKNEMIVILENNISATADSDGTAKGVRNLSKRLDDLPGKNVLTKLEENKKEPVHGKTAKGRLKFDDGDPLRNHPKNIPYSPKYLRSHLRNGKVVKFESQDVALRRIRKNLQNIGMRNEVKVNIGKKLMNNLKENVVAKPVAIKRHCEKCGISFANKELFTLHPCYYD